MKLILALLATLTAAAPRGLTAPALKVRRRPARRSRDAFARDLAAAGGAGLITPDLVPDEASDWFEASDAHGLDRIFLVSPSSTDERITSTSELSLASVCLASRTVGAVGSTFMTFAPQATVRIASGRRR